MQNKFANRTAHFDAYLRARLQQVSDVMLRIADAQQLATNKLAACCTRRQLHTAQQRKHSTWCKVHSPIVSGVAFLRGLQGLERAGKAVIGKLDVTICAAQDVVWRKSAMRRHSEAVKLRQRISGLACHLELHAQIVELQLTS